MDNSDDRAKIVLGWIAVIIFGFAVISHDRAQRAHERAYHYAD
jgi:hypothetical protein